jgi:hypothetical protein
VNELDVHQKARDIAYALDWHYPEPQDGWNARIVNPETHAELWIANDRGRCRISGGFGELHKYLRYERHGKNEITVNPQKTPPQIVRDIRQRLLPDYLQDLGYCQQREQEHRARMQGIANAALKFAAILRMPPPEVSEDERARFHVPFSSGVYGDVQIDSQSVDVKLTDVPFHVAAMMLVPLGEYIEQHPKEGEDAD